MKLFKFINANFFSILLTIFTLISRILLVHSRPEKLFYMYNPLSIANYFVKKSWEEGKELTPMKLVKLVYIAHGWHLAITEQPLLTEVPQAWKYGPVIPSVYHAFKSYGNSQITRLYSVLGRDDIPEVTAPPIRLLLDKVWEIYSKYNGIELSALTHKNDTPWDKVWNQNGGKEKQDVIIPNNIIASHYKQVIDGYIPKSNS